AHLPHTFTHFATLTAFTTRDHAGLRTSELIRGQHTVTITVHTLEYLFLHLLTVYVAIFIAVASTRIRPGRCSKFLAADIAVTVGIYTAEHLLGTICVRSALCFMRLMILLGKCWRQGKIGRAHV